jgi:hypothetical protein
MHKLASIAAMRGDGLRPELRALFERLAIDRYAELFVRSDGMLQSGPDPKSEPPSGPGRDSDLARKGHETLTPAR